MALSQAQLTALKNDIAANTNTIQFGPNTVQIKDLPNNPDANVEIAAWYNGTATPTFWVWRPDISRSEVYHATSPASTTWNWATYKAQSITEQNAWTQMFMGDVGPIGQVNFRAGIAAIFTGSQSQTDQRNHCFACGRRAASRAEKLLSTAVVNPPANTGNTSGDAQGSATNPNNITLSGSLTGDDVTNARNLA